MALELGDVAEQVLLQLEHVRGRQHPGGVGRGARAQAARQRHVGADPEREAVGRVQPREAAHAEVAPVARDVELRVDAEAAGLDDLELDVQRQRRREHVEAGPEVRRRRGHADEPAALGRHPSTASSTAARFGSQGITPPAWLSAVSGSFRPWPVSTQATRARAVGAVAQQPGDRGGAGGLAEDALARGEQAVGGEDLGVGDGAHHAARGGHRLHRLLPAGRVADPDRAGDRLGVVDALAEHERRGALGLEAEQPRRDAVLDEALVVGGDVARVADGDAERVELAELLDDLERRGLLALEAVLVDGVDERDRLAVGERAHERQRLVEVAAQGDHARAVHERLGELALGDLALRHDHRAGQAAARGVGGGARGGVAGRGADDGLGALAHGGADGARHAAILERAGRVEALELQPHLGLHELGEVRRVDERGAALAERDDGIVGGEGQALAVALHESGHRP